MKRLREFALKELGSLPEQVRSLRYPIYLLDPHLLDRVRPVYRQDVFVEKSVRGREEQKTILAGPSSHGHKDKRSHPYRK